MTRLTTKYTVEVREESEGNWGAICEIAVDGTSPTDVRRELFFKTEMGSASGWYVIHAEAGESMQYTADG